MKRLVAAFVGGCLLASASVGQAAEKVMYQEITDNKPDVGVSTTVYLGDKMLQQRRGQWQECVVPNFNSEKSLIGFNFVVKSGEPICLTSIKSNRYISSYTNVFQGPYTYNKPVKIKNKNNQIQLCAVDICTDWVELSQFNTDPYFVYTVNSIQQVIEYAGRNGDNLKFTYSEFLDGYARQAFTREFQVDLTQGKVAAYKGAIIEIESATNSSITYKVVRNFQQ
jgi:hypothetical protein